MEIILFILFITGVLITVFFAYLLIALVLSPVYEGCYNDKMEELKYGKKEE